MKRVERLDGQFDRCHDFMIQLIWLGDRLTIALEFVWSSALHCRSLCSLADRYVNGMPRFCPSICGLTPRDLPVCRFTENVPPLSTY